MLKRLLAVLVAAVILAGVGLGCGGDKDKGINSHRERPRAPDKAER